MSLIIHPKIICRKRQGTNYPLLSYCFSLAVLYNVTSKNKKPRHAVVFC